MEKSFVLIFIALLVSVPLGFIIQSNINRILKDRHHEQYENGGGTTRLILRREYKSLE